MASKVACSEPFIKGSVSPTFGSPGQLSAEDLDKYFEEGYVVVRDFFTPEELEPCKYGLAEMVDELAQKLYRGGKITELHEDAGVFERLTLLEEDFRGAFMLFFKVGKLHESLQKLWQNDRMLNLMEQLVGPDVAGHPVWNIRPKVPNNKATAVPWHQDSAYFSEDSYEHLIPTAWIPFLDTGPHNGGMQVVKNAHKKGIVAEHTCCWEDTPYVNLSVEEMEKSLDVNSSDDVVTCEIPYGGFLLFHNITPHRSLPNNSEDVRWSVDLRWQSPHKPWGFYDIQEGVVMREKHNPDLSVDWSKFLSVNRKDVWQKRHSKGGYNKNEFDTTLTGPWIGRWQITNENQHTRAFQSSMA